MSDRYHQILKVKKGASKTEVRRAFRDRAKELHPDKNKNANAHDEFILLSEAYDHLMGRNQGSRPQSATTRSSESGSQARREKERREATRERARKHAKMKYEAFKKTQFYRNEVAVGVLFDYAMILIGILVLAIPVASFFLFDAEAIVPVVVTFVILAAIPWNVFVSNSTEHHVREVLPALRIVMRTTTFQVVAMIIFNLLVYFTCTFKTLVSFNLILVLGIICFAVPYLFWKRLKQKRTNLWCGLVGPTLINVFFLVNYSISGQSHFEEYRFERNELFLIGGEDGYTIRLEDDVYDEYVGVRFFVPDQRESYYKRVRYQFQEGLLGLRIKKDHRLFRRTRSGKIEFLKD